MVYVVGYICPGSPSRLFFEWFLNRKDDIVLVGIYNQQFKGTILFMVFDFQGLVDFMVNVGK